MIIVYYDESGDDGWPGASDLFVLSGIYISEWNWKNVFTEIQSFRRDIRDSIGLGIRREIHTKDFLENRKEYHHLKLKDNKRKDFITKYCDLVSSLKINVVNVVIDKSAIYDTNYDISERSLTYSIQRIDNHLYNNETVLEEEGFNLQKENMIIFTDPGRIGKMRKTARKIQVINPIPSKEKSGGYYDKPIERVIEDPVQKESHHSGFIQISDLVATLNFQYMKNKLGLGTLPGRIRKFLTHEDIQTWLNILEPVFNVKASSENKYGYGIVCYPKK